MIKAINKIKDTVKELLVDKPHLRDCDRRLTATVWSKEIGGMSALTNLSAYELLNQFVKGKLSSPESIRRARQKIQEEIPDLRGQSYTERKYLANQTRKQI